jgi:hypothetical protein
LCSLVTFLVHTTDDQRFQFVNAYYYGPSVGIFIFIPSFIIFNLLFPAILTASVLQHYSLSDRLLSSYRKNWEHRCNRDALRALRCADAINRCTVESRIVGLAAKFLSDDRWIETCKPHEYKQPLRALVSRIVRHPGFEVVSVILSLIAVFLLFLDPIRDAWTPEDAVSATQPSDVWMLILFLIEVLLRFIAEPDLTYYLASRWNQLDLLALVSMIFAFFFPRSRPLRVLRVLRLLRLTLRVPTLRTVLEGLWSAVPAMVDVLILGVFLFFCFALVGLGLFCGATASCTDETIENIGDCVGVYAPPDLGSRL